MPPKGKRPFWVAANSLKKQFINLILPPTCANCGQVGLLICDSCRLALRPVQPPVCSQCGHRLKKGHETSPCAQCQKRPFPLQSIHAAFHYEQPLIKLIHRLKYSNTFALAEPLALLMSNQWPLWAKQVDVIVPIPLHPSRKKKRGYNQSELLATHFGHALQKPVRSSWLIRQRATQPQVELPASARLTNMKDAFLATQSLPALHVLLIDDVATTGATMTAAAETLLDAGVTAVSGYTLARTSAINR